MIIKRESLPQKLIRFRMNGFKKNEDPIILEINNSVSHPVLQSAAQRKCPSLVYIDTVSRQKKKAHVK